MLKISDKLKLGVGLDISENQFPKNYPHNIQFLVSNASVLPFKDESFDGVVSTELFEHLYSKDARRMINEIRRILKTNGRFVITTPRRGKLWLCLVPLFTTIDFFYGLANPELKEIWTKRRKSRKELQKKHGVNEHVKEYTKNELINILEDSGFIVLESTGSTISPYLSLFTRANEFSPIFFRFWKWINGVLTGITEKFYCDTIVFCKKRMEI